jgi:hypothetical protein
MKRLITVLAALVILSGCGDITSTSSTGSSDQTDTSMAGVWSAEIDTESDGGDVGISCDDLTGLVEGEKGRCYVHFLVTNVSDLPQELSGYYYLEADGVTYLSESGYQNPVAINPNDYVTRRVTFYIPYLANVTNLYMAESPTDQHLFDLGLNVNIRR